MKSIPKYFHLCVGQTLLFALAAYAFWYALYPSHLHFHEQFQLFQYSERYFHDTMLLPGGFAHYLSRFLVQFFYHAGTGAAVMVLLITSIQLLTALHLPRLSKRWALYPLTFLPAVAVWVFLLDANAMPVVAVNVCMVLIVAFMGKKIEKQRIRWIYETVAGCVLFVLAGGNGLIFFLLMGIYEATLAFRKGERGRSVTMVLAGLVLFLTIPMFGTYLYNYPYSQLMQGYGTFRFPQMECPARTAALLILVVVVGLIQSDILPKRRQGIICLVLWVCMAMGGFLVIRGNMSGEEESVFCYDHLVRTEQWDEIIRKADQKRPSNVWEQCCLNLALARKGILCDRMFAYPQQGRESLIPIYQRDYMTPMIGGEPYFYMGVTNTAQRFAFEAMEAIPDYQKSTRCYQRLAVTNIVNGRYKVAAEYLRILKKTHYYRTWAERMETYLYNDRKVEADPQMGWMRMVRYERDFFFSEGRINDMLALLLMEHPQNWMAWQYLLAYCMVKRDVPLLARYVILMQRALPGKALPTHVQEALMLGWLQEKRTLEGLPWKMDLAVRKRFVEFAKAANQRRELAEPALRNGFANTYGCYHLLGKEDNHE